MEMVSVIWLVLFIVLLIIEAATLALVTIWFAGGALVGLVLSMMGVPVWLQILLAIITSVAMLIFLFPIAKKKLNVGKARTNVSSLIGKIVVVVEPIEFNKFGQVSVNGVIWSASSSKEVKAEERVKIIQIEGNKLIVSKVD